MMEVSGGAHGCSSGVVFEIGVCGSLSGTRRGGVWRFGWGGHVLNADPSARCGCLVLSRDFAVPGDDDLYRGAEAA
jgi:hypothetical protein